MSLAIPTYATGAIDNYERLVEEIRDMVDDATYGQDKIDRAIRKAEAHFNRVLRTPEMEKVEPVATSEETVSLPLDFLQVRSVVVDGQPDKPLTSMSPQTLALSYGGAPGMPLAYAIEGRQMRVAPYGPAALIIVYYAQIPPLSFSTSTNWLLDKHPDLYVAGIMYHLAVRERDTDGMAAAANTVEALVAVINRDAQRNRWGSSPLTPQGIRQVRGARA